MTAQVATSTEDRALALLGSGVGAESVAAALGVTPSRISQLLSDEDFAVQVAALRYENLQQHSVRDSKYDTLEDKLLEKLERSMAFMIRPETILKAIQIVNNAKRRGQSAPEQITQSQNIVNLILPVQITQKFATNMNNQVTKAGDQELLTMPANSLLELTERLDTVTIMNTKPIEAQTEVVPNPETQPNETQNEFKTSEDIGVL